MKTGLNNREIYWGKYLSGKVGGGYQITTQFQPCIVKIEGRQAMVLLRKF
jgi:hypothetical protein